jgi:hypothetical protein
LTSRRPIGKGEAFHHVVVVTRGSYLSLQKSKILIGMSPPPGVPTIGGGGGQARVGGEGQSRLQALRNTQKCHQEQAIALSFL